LPMVEIKRRLSWVDFLAPLSDDELDDLVGGATFVRLEEKEVLAVGPEEHAERMLLVVAGQLQVYEVALSSGRELTLWVLASGSAVGTTGLVPRWTRELHIRALEPSVVCRIERRDLEELMRTNPEVGVELSRVLANQLMLMEDRWADMVEKEVSARLAGLIYMLVEDAGVMTPEGPMLPTRYTHAQLASMIGANREAVTRAIGQLREGGCVEVKRRHLYIKDFDALRRDAGE
jgi:CRP/FNR family transcriptional regulator, cyclic AMP receptor protein